MLRNLIGAEIGSRLTRNQGAKGALVGAARPWLLRRAFTPLGVVALGVYGAKKYYDYRRDRRRAPAATASA